MNATQHWLHRILDLYGALIFFNCAWEALTTSTRIHPYTSMGWHKEQAIVGLSFLPPIAMMLLSTHPAPRMTKALSALLLATISFAAYKRYFSLPYELLTFTCLINSSLQTFLLRKTSLVYYLGYIVVSLITLACTVFLIAGHIIVGA